MKIVENLSALALRQLIDGASETARSEGAAAVDLWMRQFSEHGERLKAALARACDHTWKALEVALAGQPWWDACKAQLHPGEETALGDKVQAFLAASPAEAAGLTPESRRQCLAELRAARQAGLLGGDLQQPPEIVRLAAVVPADPQAARDADWQLIAQIAAELRQPFPALAEFLAVRPASGQLLLADAGGYFLRREIQADPQLAPVVTTPGKLTAEQQGRLAALADLLTQHSQRLEELLTGTVPAQETMPGPHSIEIEVRGQPEPIPHLARAVIRLLQRCRLQDGVLRPSDPFSITDEDVRKQIRDLAARFHSLPEAQRRLPALQNGLAMLQVTAGDLEPAQRDLQTAAVRTTEPRLLAVIEFNGYRTALERGEVTEALSLLQRAATLRPDKFALFPADRYEPERLLGQDCGGVTFLCKHRPSNSQVFVRSLWLGTLDRDGADVMREAQMLTGLDQPAILRPLECDFADSEQRRPFVVTDAFDGLSLRDHVRQHGPLTPDDVLRLARPIAESLQAVHERGLLHRNLNPTTVLVRKDGTSWQVKLTGFGLSLRPGILYSALSGGPGWSRTLLGSNASLALSYTAPEQTGWLDGVGMGPASDVYSFGKVCYFALLGTPDPDDEEKDALPAAWRKLLGACTARNVSRRVANFQVLLKRLGQTAGPKDDAASARAPAAGSNAEQAQNYLNRGMAYRQQGDTHRALAAYSKALQLDPNLAAGYIKRGNTYLDRGEIDRAIADYSAVLKIEPNNAAAYMNRGLANAKKGDFDAVIADCGEAIRLDPKLSAAYSIRGTAYWERGDRHRAIAEYTLAIRYDENNALAFNGRGLAFADSGDYQRAVSDYTAALRIDPRLVVAYVNRGNALRQAKRYDRALPDFTRALKLDPRNLLALFNRGLTFIAAGAPDRAVTDFERVLQLDPNFPDAATRRDEARQAAARAGPSRPKPESAGQPSPVTSKTAAPVTAKQPAPADERSSLKGKPTAPNDRRPSLRPKPLADAPLPPRGKPAPAPEERPARGYVQEEEERRQIRAAAFFARGRTMFDQGKYSLAIDQFTKAVQIDPKDAQAYYHRGLAHVAQKEFTEAIGDYTDAIRLNPRNAMSYYHRGTAHRLAGQHDQAIADYSRALKLDGRLAVAYRNRSLSYTAKGDTERARADYQEAVRLDPSLAKDK